MPHGVDEEALDMIIVATDAATASRLLAAVVPGSVRAALSGEDAATLSTAGHLVLVDPALVAGHPDIMAELALSRRPPVFIHGAFYAGATAELERAGVIRHLGPSQAVGPCVAQAARRVMGIRRRRSPVTMSDSSVTDMRASYSIAA